MNILKGTVGSILPMFLSSIVMSQTVDKNNTLSADRPIIACPAVQPKVKNGSKPSIELCKQMIQCASGEYPASKGYDGAVTVDVSSIQMMPARKWDMNWDGGRGDKNTIVYPVKATFTKRQFFRARTTVASNEVTIFNFYVNDYGEWAIGFRELVKPSTDTSIPRQ